MEAPFAGARLTTRHPNSLIYETRSELDRLRVDRTCIVYATFVDRNGVSVYIKRGNGRSDIEGFIPNGGLDNWMSYFDVGTVFGDKPNAGYVGTRHYTRVFPDDFV